MARLSKNTVFSLALQLSLLLYSATTSNAADRKYVNSIKDFRIHVQSHITRVQAIGNYLLEQHPNNFSFVDPKILRAFLGLHDQSKINQSLKFYHEHHLPEGSASILEQLYKVYSVKYEELPPDKQGTMEFLIGKLNQVDLEVRNAFFEKYALLNSDGSLSDAAKQYVEIEKIADTVDRGEAPISAEEFHGRMIKASTFLQDPADQKYAKELEAKYLEITKDLDFASAKARHYRHRDCDSMYSQLLNKRSSRYIFHP